MRITFTGWNTGAQGAHPGVSCCWRIKPTAHSLADARLPCQNQSLLWWNSSQEFCADFPHPTILQWTDSLSQRMLSVSGDKIHQILYHHSAWASVRLFSDIPPCRLWTFGELMTQQPHTHRTTGRCCSLSPSQTLLTHYRLLAKTRAVLEHISQTFRRSKRKPEGNCHGIDSIHQTVHTACSWPLGKQGRAPKAPWTCFNKFSAFHNYRTTLQTFLPTLQHWVNQILQ